jgi:hypothetical protein
MAASFTPAKVATPGGSDTTYGNKKRRVRDITVSGTYTTGGDTIDPVALFGLRSMDEFNIHGVPTDGTLAYPASYIPSTGKLKFWETGTAAAGSAEKGSGESLAGITFRVTAYGSR